RKPDAHTDARDRIASRLVLADTLEVGIPGQHTKLAVELDRLRDAPRADRGETDALDVDDVVVQHGRADERARTIRGRVIAEAVVAALEGEYAAEGITAGDIAAGLVAVEDERVLLVGGFHVDRVGFEEPAARRARIRERRRSQSQ